MAADRGVHSVDTWPLPTQQPISSEQVREKGQAVSRTEVSLFLSAELGSNKPLLVLCPLLEAGEGQGLNRYEHQEAGMAGGDFSKPQE